MFKYNSEKKLRVFEAFAGIGAQASALDRIGIDYEIVGISEWFIDALKCYQAIHYPKSVDVSPKKIEDVEKYLSDFTFSADSVKAYDINRLSDEAKRALYNANRYCKNFGSITDLKGNALPDMDLLVYSFPCQDLSTGGKCLGMKKGSNTRSCLLWEIERILTELNEVGKLPEYLLMENVKTILAPSNKPDLDLWLNFLETLGYSNDDCMLLNATDFGVPQDRERAFIVSHLGQPLNVGEKIKKKKTKIHSSKFFKTDYSNPVYRAEADDAKLNKTPSRNQMWDINGMELNDDTVVRTITCNMDRTHCAGIFLYENDDGEYYRRPTMREAYLLMGFKTKEYERAKRLGFSYRKMNKLIGNSIVVDVLAAIFKAMFEEN